jgi:hypothetical protein
MFEIVLGYSYHARLLLKVLVYGYLTNTYSSRKLKEQLRQNVHFMWLCGMANPDQLLTSTPFFITTWRCSNRYSKMHRTSTITKMAIIDGNIDISELVGLWEFNFFHSEFPTKISCISKYMLRYRRKI